MIAEKALFKLEPYVLNYVFFIIIGIRENQIRSLRSVFQPLDNYLTSQWIFIFSKKLR
jgi:hypothetical protein